MHPHNLHIQFETMTKTVLITGANGFIARHLIPILEKQQYRVKLLTRSPRTKNEYFWDLHTETIDSDALENVNAIIHLSGSKLNDGTPLTEERKREVYNSRIGAANFLRNKLKALNQKLDAFISASAIGYYGFTDNTLEIDESGEKGSGFNAQMCEDWEKAADLFKTEGVAKQVSKIRVSLALGREYGIFPMYKSMIDRGAKITDSSNRTSLPWNHIEDMAGIFAFALEHELDGVFNSVAPDPASGEDLLKLIANHTSQANYKIEPFEGKHLIAQKIRLAGYRFKFTNLQQAVADLLD